MDKRKLYVIFTIIIVALLPSAVFASVIIDQSYGVSTSTPPNLNPVEMTTGPNYKTANSLGFATLTNGTAKGQTSVTTNHITFGYVDNDTEVELVDVLEVKDNSSKAATVSLTVSSATDMTFYYSSTAVPSSTAFPTTTDLGTALTSTATSISLSAGGIEYISVIITGPDASATLTMESSIS